MVGLGYIGGDALREARIEFVGVLFHEKLGDGFLGLVEGSAFGWVTPYHFGIDQGPIVLMTQNYLTGLLWDLMKKCPAIVTGLRRAGFTGGWL